MKLAGTRCVGTALLALAAMSAEAAPIAYAQLEGSSTDTNLVLVGTLPAIAADQPASLLTGSAVRWRTGEALNAAVVPRWGLGASGVTVGLGVGAAYWRSRDAANPDTESGLALRAQIEWQGALPGGRGYALLQGSTFRSAGLGVLQYALDIAPLALEVSHYGEKGYDVSSAGVRFYIPGTRWSLRAGVSHSDGDNRPFVGVAYNGF